MLLLFAVAWAEDTGETSDTGDACTPRDCSPDDLLVSPASCTSGETISLSASGCEGGTYDWADDMGGTFEGEGAEVAYTCPAVWCPDAYVTIYAVAFDSCGLQYWLFGSVEVTCAEDIAGDQSKGGCGCATPASPALVPALAALALLRRRSPEAGARSRPRR
jgi:uncharacterized protein (TIGR03382 family)